MFIRHRHRHHVSIVVGRGQRTLHRLSWGGLLIAAGVGWLLKDRGLLEEHELWLVLPAVLAWSALAGMAIDRSAASVARGVARLAIAAYAVVVIEQLGGWTLAATWPVLLIALGVACIARALLVDAPFARRRRDAEPNW